ncbi:MAG TPA: DUF3341 domain-containing protein [Polyangiales bacterium]|nr:DUF3341 domain-containing protein [Polyangiales bacterium]
MTSKKAVIGLVSSFAQAERLVDTLQSAGVPRYEISALFPDSAGTRDFALEKNTKAPEGAAAGVSAGGAIGGTIGLLAGIGALAIPGLGPFIAAGPIMAALSGAAAGAAIGGLTGALIGMGIPELEARAYEGKVRDGHILLSVHVDDNEQRDRVKMLLERAGAQDVTVAGEKEVPEQRRPQGTPAGLI